MTKQPTPAVAAQYIRMSSSKQEASPEQQREALAVLARQHNCSIEHEYLDSGISGIETTKRPDFLRMIEDAESGKFKFILLWDQDRLSRLDSLDNAEFVNRIRKAGVSLITVGQGLVNLNTFEGRVAYGVQQELKNQYLDGLARNSLRGKIAAARDGRLCFTENYGLVRVIIDAEGNERQRVAFGERFSKPRDWRARKDVADDESAELVRWMFKRLDETDCSVSSLCQTLNERGIEAPRGGEWYPVSLFRILENPVYAGDFVFGRRCKGKFHRTCNGTEEHQTAGTFEDEPIVLRDAHPALIDRDLFDRVQAKLENRKKKNRRPRNSPFVLSGIVLCGHCGGPMYGWELKQSDAQGKRYRYYRCRGKRNTCRNYVIRADALENYIAAVLTTIARQLVDRGLAEAIAEEAKRSGQKPGAELETLNRKLERLNRQLNDGNERLLDGDFDADQFAELKAIQAKRRQERDRLQQLIATMDGQHDVGSVEAVAARAMELLADLPERIQSGDVCIVREVIRSVVDSVSLWWRTAGGGKNRNVFRLQRGLVTVNPKVSPFLTRVSI